MAFWKLFSLKVFQSWFVLFATSKIMLRRHICLSRISDFVIYMSGDFFAYFKFHGDWGRVIGKIKQNKLDCRDTAPLKFVLSFTVWLSFFPWRETPGYYSFVTRQKKHPNNTNTEIRQCVNDTTKPEPVAKNQGNMIQDTVNE